MSTAVDALLVEKPGLTQVPGEAIASPLVGDEREHQHPEGTPVGVRERVRCARVSVIIPTHDRPLRLRRLLGTLATQGYPAHATELIVAQDGGDKQTSAAIDEVRAKAGIPIKHVYHERCSAAATRNLGASLATGEYLLFVDDDGEVDQHWIERTVAAFEGAPEVGEVTSRIVGASARFFARCHDYARYYPSMQAEPSERAFACGCAFGIRRSLFEALGGFDESIETGEDEDLGLRMQALGYKAVYRPECLVYHHHGRDTFRAMLQRAYVWGMRGEVDRHLAHRGRATYGRFASSNPYFYLMFSPVIALAVTLRIWLCLWREVRMPLYLPFIFCDKLVWCWATYRYLKRRRGEA